MVAGTLGFATRIGLFLLCVLFNKSVVDYDSSLSLVTLTQPGSHASTHTPLGKLLSAVCKWDSLFFIQIAHEGYIYEKNHAFFPMYPLLIRYGALLFQPLISIQWLSIDEAYLLTGLLISWVSFAVSAVLIEKYSPHRLSFVLLQDYLQAEWSRNLFLMTPAGVFMTAIYSESLFTCFVCAGLCCLYKRPLKTETQISAWQRTQAACFFALACATRSNGSLLLIFQICISVKVVLKDFRKTVQEAFFFGFLAGVQLAPIVAYLWYVASIYCTGTTRSPYCSSYLPNAYAYIQATYWCPILRNVGWFTYWELKQLSNFILAAPVLLFSLKVIYTYIRHDITRFLTFGCCASKTQSATLVSNNLLLPFIYYWIAYVFVLVAIANVQIATRQLASLPALYWFSAEQSRTNKVLILYCIAYNFIGAILFSNFYPWT